MKFPNEMMTIQKLIDKLVEASSEFQSGMNTPVVFGDWNGNQSSSTTVDFAADKSGFLFIGFNPEENIFHNLIENNNGI